MPARKGNQYANANKGGGRPEKYRPEYAEQARKLCQLGFTDEGLANFFGVDERTINRWKIEREEFLSARGRRPINAKAESLYAWGSENVADARHC
jgi:hypothetical protein